jgi:hypothetical protein
MPDKHHDEIRQQRNEAAKAALVNNKSLISKREQYKIDRKAAAAKAKITKQLTKQHLKHIEQILTAGFVPHWAIDLAKDFKSFNFEIRSYDELTYIHMRHIVMMFGTEDITLSAQMDSHCGCYHCGDSPETHLSVTVRDIKLPDSEP